jgi:hypothetical protein
MIIADVIKKHIKHVHYKNAFGIECDPISDIEITALFMANYNCDTVNLQGTDFDNLELLDRSIDTTVTTTCNSTIEVITPSITCNAQIQVI